MYHAQIAIWSTVNDLTILKTHCFIKLLCTWKRIMNATLLASVKTKQNKKLRNSNTIFRLQKLNCI